MREETPHTAEVLPGRHVISAVHSRCGVAQENHQAGDTTEPVVVSCRMDADLKAGRAYKIRWHTGKGATDKWGRRPTFAIAELWDSDSSAATPVAVCTAP